MFGHDDEEAIRQALCERCRKFVPISNIKYLPKGNDSRMALCQTCLKTFKVEKPKSGASNSGGTLESYFCSRCNYAFKVSSTKASTLRCPYCGKSDRINSEKKRSTETLLREEADF